MEFRFVVRVRSADAHLVKRIFQSVEACFGFAPSRVVLSDFKAFGLAKEFYWECRKKRLPSFLQLQLLRASSSIALNLAEGSARRGPADQKRFYLIAFSSLRECQAIMELENLKDDRLAQIATSLGAILYRLTTKPSFQQKPKTETPVSKLQT